MSRSNSLLRVPARRTADGHEIHRAVREKLFEIGVAGPAVLGSHARHFFGVRAAERGNLESRDFSSRARVGLRNVSAADDANVHAHDRRAVARESCEAWYATGRKPSNPGAMAVSRASAEWAAVR
jgi:hypothetical protein